jgi:hypothetical protein
MYAAKSKDLLDGDYIALVMVDGQLQLRFTLNLMTAII